MKELSSIPLKKAIMPNFFRTFCAKEKVNMTMKAKKILFITQEMTPYVPDSELAAMGRELPQEIQEKGREIRTFMPNGEISTNVATSSTK